MRTPILAICLAVSTCFATAPAHSQQTLCAQREIVTADLEGKYQEYQSFVGISEINKTVVELWSNQKVQPYSWTIISYNPLTKVACVLDAGKWGIHISPPVEGEPS